MTTAVRAILESFNAFSDGDQYTVAVEILRRTMRYVPYELSDDALVAAADHLFSGLDHQESENRRRSTI